MQRQGHTNTNATSFGIMDNLSYTYNTGNKLLQVDESAENSTGFKDVSGLDFTYDDNGNMITDVNKGITNITYNHLNLPTQVQFAGQYSSIHYVYDATGIKLEKKVSGMSITQTITEYAGNYIYEKVGSGNTDLQFFNHAEGYVKYENNAFDYVYQYKDHLGNVRLSYADSNNDGNIQISANTGGNYSEIIEESNYYPFGLKHKGYNNVTSSNGSSVAQKKLFNGKEFQDELGLNWHDYGARNYDASLGRWMNIDPLAGKRSWLTPYNNVQNNPLIRIDPDGMIDIRVFGKNNKETPSVVVKTDKIDVDVHTDQDLPVGQELLTGAEKPLIEVDLPDVVDAALGKFLDSKSESQVFMMSASIEGTIGKGKSSSSDIVIFNKETIADYITTYDTDGVNFGGSISAGTLTSKDGSKLTIDDIRGKSSGYTVSLFGTGGVIINSEKYRGKLSSIGIGAKFGVSKFKAKTVLTGGWGKLEKDEKK